MNRGGGYPLSSPATHIHTHTAHTHPGSISRSLKTVWGGCRPSSGHAWALTPYPAQCQSPSLDTPLTWAPQRPGSRRLTNFINREIGPKRLDSHPQSHSCRRLSQGSNPEPELSATLLPAGPSPGHHIPPPTLWHFHSLGPSSEIYLVFLTS